MDKKELRKIFLEKRKSIENKEEKSHEIFHKLKGLPIWKKAYIINTYVSIKDEVDTRFIIYHALIENKRVFCPVILGNDLKFGEITSINDLEKGPFGILQPKKIHEIDYNLFDIIIVPGIAFDIKGYRIGYGKGYYDRFLSKIKKGIKIGLTFDDLILNNLPKDPYDQKVDIIISEKKIIFTNLLNTYTR
jgi:5-formyltetrahydrofolate cyclo-ligase